MVQDSGSAACPQAVQATTVRETVDLCTPPRSADQIRPEHVSPAPTSIAAKRNLAKNMNRKANASFAREMKESLAAGRPPTRHVADQQTDLKTRWHAAAKTVAYKLLDLRRDGWKEYTNFDKARVHKELAAVYKFDPPLDEKRVEKYLSGHLRTSRAVWKAHWLKYGESQRHHNCPEEAWEALTKWWPTSKCQTAAADMAARRAKVQTAGASGRTSLIDRMTKEVRNNSVHCLAERQSSSCSAYNLRIWETLTDKYEEQIPHTL